MLDYYQFKFTICDYQLKNINNFSENLNVEIECIKEELFISATVGNSNTGKNEVNEEIRKGKKLNGYTVKLWYDLNQYRSGLRNFLEETDIQENESFDYFELLKYEEGDFFKPHQDGKKSKNHIGTILIYPHKNYSNYEGGELYLPEKNITIQTYENDWSIVFLNLNTLHEVKPITRGTKYVLKKDLYISTETRLLIENKICDYLEVIPNIQECKVELEKIEEEIKKQEDVLNQLRRVKNGLKILNDGITFKIINKLKNVRKVKLVCQNYYSEPTLEKLIGIDKNIFGIIQKEFGEKLQVRMVNMEGNIEIGEKFEKLEIEDLPKEGQEGEEFDHDYFSFSEIINWNNQKINLYFDDWTTIRISYDNFGTGKFNGIETEWNDQTYEHYLKMDVSCILLRLSR